MDDYRVHIADTQLKSKFSKILKYVLKVKLVLQSPQTEVYLHGEVDS